MRLLISVPYKRPDWYIFTKALSKLPYILEKLQKRLTDNRIISAIGKVMNCIGGYYVRIKDFSFMTYVLGKCFDISPIEIIHYSTRIKMTRL